MSDIFPPNKPATFSARNIRTHYNRRKIGEVFHIDIEVEESVWNQLRTVPENALIEIVAWWHEGDTASSQIPIESKPEKPAVKSEKSAKESGPYSEFWRIMVVRGVRTYPDLQECLDATPEHVWEALHAVFETETMSTVSPRQWEAWVTENGLSDGLITMSRNAEIQAAQKVN